MVDLPKKKVGIIACSGEELPEGTVTRLAALKVLEKMRPAETVTICLPLFLAGGEGDRAFARFYPTIAVDGCELRCAARATEKYSGKPAASVMVRELVTQNGLAQPEGLRRLNESGLQAVQATAEKIAGLVDDLIDQRWDRRLGTMIQPESIPVIQQVKIEEAVTATCSCGSDIPVTRVEIRGKTVEIIALPLILQQFQEAGKTPGENTARELLETVKIYNPLPPQDEDLYREIVEQAYAAYLKTHLPVREA